MQLTASKAAPSSSAAALAPPRRPAAAAPNRTWSQLATGGGANVPGLQRQTPPAAPAAAPAAASGRLANEQERKLITRAEGDRLDLLSKALPLVQDLITGIITGDSSVTLRPRGPQPNPETDKPGLDVTKRAAVSHLSADPNTYDWLNDKSDREALDTLTLVARLIAANLARPLYPKRVFDPPPGAAPADPCTAREVASNDGTNVNLQPDFFVSGVPPMPSPLCPGIILMHEYFHHLQVKPEDKSGEWGRVYHGQAAAGRQSFPSTSTRYALHDAYSLTSFVVHVALGREIECVCSGSRASGQSLKTDTLDGGNDGVGPRETVV